MSETVTDKIDETELPNATKSTSLTEKITDSKTNQQRMASTTNGLAEPKTESNTKNVIDSQPDLSSSKKKNLTGSLSMRLVSSKVQANSQGNVNADENTDAVSEAPSLTTSGTKNLSGLATTEDANLVDAETTASNYPSRSVSRTEDKGDGSNSKTKVLPTSADKLAASNAVGSASEQTASEIKQPIESESKDLPSSLSTKTELQDKSQLESKTRSDEKNNKSDSKDKRKSDSKGRKGSDSKDKKKSGSKHRKGSDSKDRKGSDSKDKKRSDSKHRKGSDSKDRKGSDSKDKKKSDSKHRKGSDSKDRKGSDSKDKKESDSKDRKGSDSKDKNKSDSKHRKGSDSKERKGSDSKGRKGSDSKSRKGDSKSKREDSKTKTSDGKDTAESKKKKTKESKTKDLTASKSKKASESKKIGLPETKTKKPTDSGGHATKSKVKDADDSDAKKERKSKTKDSKKAGDGASSESSSDSDDSSSSSESSDETTSSESSEEEVDETPMVKQNAKPFNVGEKRMEGRISQVPGPGTYSIDVAEKHMAYMHSFNGVKTMIPAVEIKCTENNMDRCIVCERAPIGDYWHFAYVEFMCRECMERISSRKMHPTKRLKIQAFRKIRDCSAIHRHEGTRAKIMLVGQKEIKKLQVKETYLSQYY